jgi:uncharacterized protein YdeI (YjbR/CyaY-like superfamily)
MDISRAKTKHPDEWLEAAPDFSRPLAAELRECIFRWEPDLTESIKWNTLGFTGRKLVCALSPCKKHLNIVFFRGTELPDATGLFFGGETNTNIRSVRVTEPARLNRKALRALLRAAVELDAQPDVSRAPQRKREPWPVPDFFTQALKENRTAAANFQSLSPSCRREWLVWLTTAKREETRAARLAQTLAALTAGRKWIDRKKA